MSYPSIPLVETYLYIANLDENPVASLAATEQLREMFGSLEQARLYTKGWQVFDKF